MSSSARILAVVDNHSETDSGVRKLTTFLKERNNTDDLSPYVSRARSRLDLVAPKIEEAKLFITSTKERSDLDDKTMYAELVSAHVAVSLFDTLDKLYAAASAGNDSTPLKMISVAANTLGAYLKRGKILKQTEYATEDCQVRDAQVKLRTTTAREMYHNVCVALDGSEQKLGLEMPPLPLNVSAIC